MSKKSKNNEIAKSMYQHLSSLHLPEVTKNAVVNYFYFVVDQAPLSKTKKSIKSKTNIWEKISIQGALKGLEDEYFPEYKVKKIKKVSSAQTWFYRRIPLSFF
jgi:hypothetical protein